MSPAAPAGWYDDGTGAQRWWDGARWTEHYADFSDGDVTLRADAVAPAVGAGVEPGWYDDGRGRQRWWDGTRWTGSTRFSGEERSFAGLVVDGRWIHFGALSEPAAGAHASLESGAELLRRGRLEKPAVARVLMGPAGPITPYQLARAVDPLSTHVLVQVAGQVWLTPVAAGRDAEARAFVAWINALSDHYRYE